MYENFIKINKEKCQWRTLNERIPYFRRWMLQFLITITLLLFCQPTKVSASDLTFNISENLPPETEVGTIQDGGSGFVIFEQTVGVEDAFDTDLLQSSGRIETIAELDRENIHQYTISLFLPPSSTYKITINVLDVNDNPPSFPDESITVEISELSSVGQEYNIISAEDSDAPPYNVQGYRLANANDYFGVNTSILQDGNIRRPQLVVLQKLDRETFAYHTVIVEAYDGGTPTAKTGRMTVNISITDSNDNAPIFTNLTYNVNIPENANPGSDVITVKATDRDVGVNGDVTYSIDRRKSDPDKLFEINANTGAIYVNKRLDAESAAEHRLTVKATDGGTQPQFGSAIVIIQVLDVNDNRPTINVIFLGSNDGTVSEGAAIGDYIARISVSDPDVGDIDRFNVSLTGGDEKFGLRTENGIVYLVRVKEKLDREETSSYDITLTATDFGSPPKSATTSFTIEVEDINDNPPRFDNNVYEVEIGEESYPGTFLIHLSATDLDLGMNSKFEYSLQPSDQSDWFSLSPQSGLITTATYLDYEVNPEPRLTVVATDFGTPRLSSSTTVVVNIGNANDTVPRFVSSSYRKTVPEDIGVGVCLLEVEASDPDSPDLPNQIVYSIAEGSDTQTEIVLHSSNGSLCVVKKLDRETKPTYFLRIRAMDKSGQQAFAQVMIHLSDVNDHRPEFHPVSYVANVAAATSVAGNPVTRVTATDADDSSETGSGYGVIEYDILSGNEQKLFSLDINTGEVVIAKPLAAYGNTVVVLRIRAKDGGDLSTRVDATVTISILNDTVASIGGPVFTQKVYTFNEDEDARIGKIIGEVTARASGNAAVAYFIRDDPPMSSWFSMDSVTGDVSVASSLDREIFQTVTLQIMASAGSPPIYGFASVVITLNDVNDNSPVFDLQPVGQDAIPAGSMDVISIPYTLPQGTKIYTLAAFDLDEGQNAQIRYSLIDNAGYFSIDSHSGSVSISSTLPHLNRNYSVTVQASDRGIPPKFTSGNLIIQALQPDGGCPTFDQNQYSVSVSEDMKLAESFATVTASASSSISYHLRPSVDAYSFGVYPDGALYLSSKLDREFRDHYVIELIAEGPRTISFSTPCISMATIEVTVNDVNDNVPFFDPNATRFSVKENMPEGSIVGAVLAADHDIGKNSDLQYSLPNGNNFFGINQHTGLITTTQSLDRESISSHVLLIQARDTSNSPLMSQVSIRVFVDDENDNTPTYLYNFSPVLALIQENQAPGLFVANLQAVDSDIGRNGQVRYAISSGPDSLFQIESSSGKVTTKTALNAGSHHSLTIEAQDNGQQPLSSTIQLEVKVLSDSENPVRFSSDRYVFFVNKETAPGSSLGSFDTTIFPSRVTREVNSTSFSLTNFYIAEGNQNDDFYVDRSSGELFTTRKLDFETQPQYHLTVTAEKSGDNGDIFTFEAQINVEDANDFSPIFPVAFYSTVVQENAPRNTKIWKFTAMDGDIGANGEITYSILNQTSSSGNLISTQKPFRIDPATGELFTNSANIDRETVPEYLLVIQAADNSETDPRVTTVTARVTVQDVNDNRPRFVSRNYFQILEDEPIGFPVLYLAAEDSDLGANSHIIYTLNHQWNTAGVTDETFRVNPTSGLITLVKKLDFEKSSTHFLNVSATDSAALDPLSSNQLLTIEVIDVNDEAPEFPQNTYFAELAENEERESLVTRVTATDHDTGINGKVTYELFDKTESFTIDEMTGIISSTRLLDREVKGLYTLTVYAHDGASPSLYTWCTVEVSILDVNDNAPSFAVSLDTEYTSSGSLILATLEIPEYLPGPSLVYTVLATDVDAGENGNIIYSIAEGNIGGSFKIDSVTGKLYTTGRLDREKTSSYRLKVVATDNGTESQSSEADINIVVLDWNDNNPTFTKSAYFGEISEGLPAGQFILTVRADDADEGLNGKVTYSIDPGTDPSSSSQLQGLFTIDPETGVITTTAMLDREKKSSHRFIVQAVDSAPYGPRKSSVSVDIEVTDVNDNYPIFSNSLIVKNVSGSASAGSDITILSAQDKDSGDNGTVFYRISGGKTEPFGSWNRFQIDSNGRITSTTTLTGVHTYYLNITASDNGNPPNTADAVVVINIVPFSDPNFTNMQFDKPVYSVVVSESAPRNKFLEQVQAHLYQDGMLVDNEDSVNIVYNFALENEDEKFAISHDGIITVKDSSTLDYETLPEIHLIVRATAFRTNGDGPIHAYCTINVSSIDENDNEPRFSQDRYITEVWEGQGAGTYVLQVTASDIDSGANGEVRYHIDLGNKDEAFKIDPITGIVTTDLKLDREVEEEYKLILHAYDMGSPRQTGTSTLKVTVVDINDNEPSLNVPAPGSVSVSESLPIGNLVTKVTANDLDLDEKEIRFADEDGYQNEFFTIDRQDGFIYLAKSLDYEEMQRAMLKVQVNDSLHVVKKEILLNIEDDNDNAPVFEQQSYDAVVNELTPINTSVIRVHAQDADSSANGYVTYSLVDILPKKPAFYVDQYTGTVFANMSEVFNPHSSIYNLIVMAEDHGTPPLNCTVSIRIQIADINDHAPVFSSDEYTSHVSEAAERDTHVINVTATDADFSTENRNIYYKITAGNEGEAFKINNLVTMDGENFIGEITVASDLDRENTSSYSLTVAAFDQGTPVLSSETTITVTIDDVNDNQPIFNQSLYSASIAEDAKREPVVMVFASDPDSSSSLIFKITSGNDNGAFELRECVPSSEGCALISALNLDYEDKSAYNLSVQVWDGRDTGTSKSSVVPVKIEILDVNEHPPYFTTFLGFKKVSELVTANQTVFTLPGKDSDGGIYGELFYTILNGNSTGRKCLPADEMFYIIHQTGAIKLRYAFDYEQCQKYTFRVRAENSAEGIPRLARSQPPMSFPIEIEVVSEDEFPPDFVTGSNTIVFTMPYSASAGYIVGQVNATDADVDVGADGQIKYSLVDGKEFVIDELTGVVTLSKKLETSNTRIITVIATSGTQSAQTWIKIEIQGAPVIAPEAQILAIVFGVIAGIALVIVLILCVKHRRSKKSQNSTADRSGGQIGSDFDFSDASPPQSTNNNGIPVPTPRIINGKTNSKKNSSDHEVRRDSGHASLNGAVRHSVTNGYVYTTDGTRTKSGGKSSILSNGKYGKESPFKTNGQAVRHIVRHSLSSGRGSGLDEDTDLDKEVDLINSSPDGITQSPPKPRIRTKVSGQGRLKNQFPDSGIQKDIDCGSEVSDGPNNIRSPSLESIHVFGEEGAGEERLRIQDIEEEDELEKEIQDETKQNGVVHGMMKTQNVEHPTKNKELLSHYKSPLGTESNASTKSSKRGGGSTGGDSAYSRRGRLQKWAPEFQPLADVFSEIAKLKDRENAVRAKQNTFVMKDLNVPSTVAATPENTDPPPLITSVAEQRSDLIVPVPLGYTANRVPSRKNVGSNLSGLYPHSNPHYVRPNHLPQTSYLLPLYPSGIKQNAPAGRVAGPVRPQLPFGVSHPNAGHVVSSLNSSQQGLSVSSLPRTPISHESSFTSPAMSPNLTPSLSPLATRSPSVSTVGESANYIEYDSDGDRPGKSLSRSDPNLASSRKERMVHV